MTLDPKKLQAAVEAEKAAAELRPPGLLSQAMQRGAALRKTGALVGLPLRGSAAGRRREYLERMRIDPDPESDPWVGFGDLHDP